MTAATQTAQVFIRGRFRPAVRTVQVVCSPFGSVLPSGLGRELGPEGLDAYLMVKSIYRSGSADEGRSR
ncbi:MAG: hypothetical protein JWR32_2154 [Mycobacterium sp.]|jgi:acyl-CoA reductase-like NAD-dependent aldehyde dehydrogenase|nr:hypothetical protein [Mycobacterium sp.]